jgi:tetratricopeptide (TPR) repeat protein
MNCLAIRVAQCLLILAAVFLVACEQPASLRPLPPLDTAAFQPAVQAAVRDARERFDRIAASKPDDAGLAAAFGELAMTCHAQDLLAPAEVAYANARLLAPRDKRWPYLQGHLFNDSARVAQAREAFEAAFELDAHDPTIVQSLGQLCLKTGDLACARRMFERLAGHERTRAAAAAGLGKTALAQRDYPKAIEWLEEALRLSPGSSRLRQPLAMAYQASGDRGAAMANLRRYASDGEEPQVGDDIADALGEKVVVPQVLLRRGQRAARAGRFAAAEKAFRATIAADPGNAEAFVNLGVTLSNLDRVAQARQALEQALRLDGSMALAHLSLGVVEDRLGHDEAAIRRYQAALELDPTLLQARIHLADAFMRLGSPQRAAASYLRAIEGGATASQIRLALAMAQVKEGRLAQARGTLEQALAADSGNPVLSDTLARVLATAADAAARDVARALELASALFARMPVSETAETYAMALAASGRYAEAAKLQQQAIVARDRSGGTAPVAFMADNLSRYQHRQPARAAWAEDDPVFQPRSGAASRRIP